MNERILYQFYKETRRNIELYEKECAQDSKIPEGSEGDFLMEQIENLEKLLEAFGKNHGFQERYENEKKMQQSFTEEQVDFICYQIGEWYLEWKGKIIATHEKGQHRLGYAKEELKAMICGE